MPGFLVSLRYLLVLNYTWALLQRVSFPPEQTRGPPTTQTPPACFLIVKLEGLHISPLRCKAAYSFCVHPESLTVVNKVLNITAI